MVRNGLVDTLAADESYIRFRLVGEKREKLIGVDSENRREFRRDFFRTTNLVRHGKDEVNREVSGKEFAGGVADVAPPCRHCGIKGMLRVQLDRQLT